MDLFFAFIVILPIILFFTVIFFIVNWVKNRRFLTRTSLCTFSLSVIMILILAWYYYPLKGVLNNSLPETVTITKDNLHVELKEKEKIELLLEIINQNIYTRNASDSMIDLRFPSKNLIRIDLDYVKLGQYTDVVHLYVLSYFGNEESRNLDDLSQGNRLQINEQFYRIKEPQKLSEDIYELIVQFNEFK